MESSQLSQIDGSYLDKEFSHYVVLAQDLMRQMKSSEDRRICARYMTQCNKIKSDNLNIKYHRNRFFRYLLKTMKKTVENQTIQKDYFVHLPEEMLQMGDKNEMKPQWSPDGRTYVAAKIIPGYATLIYMAVTSKAEDGWDHDGFAKFTSYLPEINVDEILRMAKMNVQKVDNDENSKIADEIAEN